MSSPFNSRYPQVQQRSPVSEDEGILEYNASQYNVPKYALSKYNEQKYNEQKYGNREFGNQRDYRIPEYKNQEYGTLEDFDDENVPVNITRQYSRNFSTTSDYEPRQNKYALLKEVPSSTVANEIDNLYTYTTDPVQTSLSDRKTTDVFAKRDYYSTTDILNEEAFLICAEKYNLGSDVKFVVEDDVFVYSDDNTTSIVDMRFYDNLNRVYIFQETSSGKLYSCLAYKNEGIYEFVVLASPQKTRKLLVFGQLPSGQNGFYPIENITDYGVEKIESDIAAILDLSTTASQNDFNDKFDSFVMITPDNIFAEDDQ